MTDLRTAAQAALAQMDAAQYAVADTAPHRDVMAYNEAADALRAALDAPPEPVAAGTVQTLGNGVAYGVLTVPLDDGTKLYIAPPAYVAPRGAPPEPVAWPIDSVLAARLAEQHLVSYEVIQQIARAVLAAAPQPDDTALLRQALDALTESIDTMRNEHAADWRHGIPTRAAQLQAGAETVAAHEAAIAALRARLGVA